MEFNYYLFIFVYIYFLKLILKRQDFIWKDLSELLRVIVVA